MFDDLSTCISCVPKVKMARLDPQSLEFMTRKGVVAIETYLGKTVYPGKSGEKDVSAYLLSTFDCASENEMDQVMENAAEVFTDNGALDVIVYDTPEAIRSAWSVRAATLESILADFQLTDECDVVVPIPRIADFVNYVSSLEDEVELIIRPTGHAGDGNVHVNVCANDMDQEEFKKRADRFMELCYAKGKELGGLISGEHGIGSAKVTYLEEFMGKSSMNLMRGIKEVFDPKGLLNPGKVCCKL
jgi:glycolate oxidase